MTTLINYIELPATDLAATKTFYGSCFDWQFEDYGDSYMAFSAAGIDGGFNADSAVVQGGVLAILHHDDLEQIYQQVIACAGVITREIYAFPGGRRFHFLDPNGNELAIWSA